MRNLPMEPPAPVGLMDPPHDPNTPKFGPIVEEHEVPAGEQLGAHGLEVKYPDGRTEHPTAEQTRLEDILPEIYALALRVGGLKQLADIIQNTMRNAQ
jgi:hypothetical protein